MSLHSRLAKAHPATLVLATFLTAIAAGTLLLNLPLASRSGSISLVDALFTATSAVCVTGLVVVDTGSWFTPFGQLVILALIQLGGLGIMTSSVILFRLIGRTVSFRNRMVMQELFSPVPRRDIFSLLGSIVLVTVVVEGGGALLLTIMWSGEMGWQAALYSGIFHAVSAFCNAGFTLFPDSLVGYADDTAVLLIFAILIIIGGIGFPVLYDMQNRLFRSRSEHSRLSIQTKTVLATTAVLIVSGWVLFAFLERYGLIADLNTSRGMLASLFQSVTCRTAGFNTVDIAALQDATLVLLLLMMFFGASPGSCGGGVKTTTLAVIVAFTWSRITRQRRTNLFKRSVPYEVVNRSLSLVLVAIAVIGVVLFMLLAGKAGRQGGEDSFSFLAYLFETVSAFGTVGLSMGLTPALSAWGKGWIILTMLIGRVGVLTFAYIIVRGGVTGGIEHAEENIMIG
jgi:trk system potassium uptake protein TrkH